MLDHQDQRVAPVGVPLRRFSTVRGRDVGCRARTTSSCDALAHSLAAAILLGSATPPRGGRGYSAVPLSLTIVSRSVVAGPRSGSGGLRGSRSPADGGG